MSRPDNQTDDIRTTQQVQRLWRAWAAGERNELDRILAEDPTVLQSPESLADLVYSEYWLRKQIDASVTETEYLDRFPAISAQLSDQFAVAQELFGNDTSKSIGTSPSESQPEGSTTQSFELMVPKGFVALGLLGVGGMGVVVKARQESLGRYVAIKSLKAGAWVTAADRERLRKEAHVVGQLKHPNIVQIYDFIEENGKLFLVMEFVDGESLAQGISTKSIDPIFAATSIRSVTTAIQAAHFAGFLHRDIKPSNVLISKMGEVKVTDFGLARAADGSNLSMTGELLGTLAYMAPEQVSGKKSEIDFRTDVYGIGATLYELLTGRPPFIGNSPPETLMQVVHATPKQIREIEPSVPRDLASICHRCIEKEPGRRYRSVEDLHDDIERFLSGKPTIARPVSGLEQAGRWLQSHPTQLASLMAVCIAIMAFLVTSTWYFTRLSSLESIGASREEALSEARKRSQMDKYYALASSIQAKVAERNTGWTWEVQSAILEAMQYSPSRSERLKLRNALCKTLSGFDVRASNTVLSDIDPFGLAWSADGAWLAIGENIVKKADDGSEVHVVHVLGDWPERKTKQLRFPIVEPIDSSNGAVEGIRSLIFLNDNRSLVVGCRSGWIQIVDVVSGAVTHKWKAHTDWCYAMAYDPARSWLVTGSRDGSICIWDSLHFEKIQSLSASGSVSYIAILEDRIIALGLGKEQVRFMLPTFDRFVETQTQPYNYNNLLKSNDGKSLLFASSRKIVSVQSDSQETSEFSLRRSPYTKSDYLRQIDMSASGDFVSVSSNENVLFLDNVAKVELRSLALPGMGAKYVTFDRKGDCVWITNQYQLIQYDWHPPQGWNFSTTVSSETKIVESKDLISLLPSLTPSGISIRFHMGPIERGTDPWQRILISNIPDKATLIESVYDTIAEIENRSVAKDSPINLSTGVWDASDCSLTVSKLMISQASSNNETAYCVAKDGRSYWTADKAMSTRGGIVVGRLRVMNLANGELLFEWENLDSETKLRLSRIEQIVCGKNRTITISVDRKLRVHDSESFQLMREIDLGQGNTPKRTALTQDEKVAFVGTQEGNVVRVDLQTNRVDPVLRQGVEISAIALSPNGILAVGNPEGDIELWSVDQRGSEQLCRLASFPNTIKAIEFSQDGKKLVVQVDQELAARILNWSEFLSQLQKYALDWKE